jgi:hypothetical protein
VSVGWVTVLVVPRTDAINRREPKHRGRHGTPGRCRVYFTLTTMFTLYAGVMLSSTNSFGGTYRAR